MALGFMGFGRKYREANGYVYYTYASERRGTHRAGSRFTCDGLFYINEELLREHSTDLGGLARWGFLNREAGVLIEQKQAAKSKKEPAELGALCLVYELLFSYREYGALPDTISFSI